MQYFPIQVFDLLFSPLEEYHLVFVMNRMKPGIWPELRSLNSVTNAISPSLAVVYLTIFIVLSQASNTRRFCKARYMERYSNSLSTYFTSSAFAGQIILVLSITRQPSAVFTSNVILFLFKAWAFLLVRKNSPVVNYKENTLYRYLISVNLLLAIAQLLAYVS